MANNELVVTAGLNVVVSEELIKKRDLPDLERRLAGSPIKISCTINEDSINQIQSQLGKLSKNLTINANVNAQNIQQSINQAVKSEPVKVSVEADIKKGELQKQVNAFVEKFHLTFDKGESQALKAELGEILAKYDQVKKAGNWDEMNRQWDNLTSFVENYATEIDVVSERLREATKQSKLFISESQRSDLLSAFGGNKGAVKEYLDSVIGAFKWTYNKKSGTLGWDTYSTQLNNLIQTDLYNVNANSIDDVAKINTTHIVEGLKQLGDLLNQDKSLADEWYKTYSGDLEALRQMWEGLRQGVVDYLHEIRGEKQSLADMGWEDIGSSGSTEKVRNYTQVLKEGLEKIASLKAQIRAEGGDAIKSVTSRFTADATGNVDGFVLAIQKSNGEVENLYHKLVEVEDETGNITREWARTQITGSDSGIQKAIEQASKSADTLERRLINLKAAADDKSAPRPIKSEESIGKVEAAYNKAIEAIEKLRQADKSTFAELDNEAKKAVDEFNNVVKAMRNADTAATKLRAKPIETIKAEETASLDKFVATIANSAIPNIENLTKRVDELRNKLSALKTGDKQGLTNYLDNFSILEEQFKTLNTQAKITKSVLNDLGKMPQNSNVKALTNEYQALMSQIGTAKTVDDYRAISETLATLKPLFNEIIQKTNDETIAAEKTANAIKAISDAYNQITNINKKLTAGNLTSVEANYYKEDIKALEILAIEERQNLEYAGLYTDEVKKQIQAIKDKSNAIVDARNQQKASDEALSSALQIYNKELDTIKKSYSEIASKWQPKITSLNSTDTDAAIAQVHEKQLRDLIRASQQRLEAEGLIDQTILDEIAHGEQLITEARDSAKAKNEEAEIKKREAEARKQEKQDLQDVNKLIKDNLAALEKFNNSTVAKNNKSNANVAGQVGSNAYFISQLTALQNSLKSDNSATNVAKVKKEIEELGERLKDARYNSEALQRTLANSSAEATLEAKIKTLTSQMNIFAEANQRAIESTKKMRGSDFSFADTWNKMMSSLSSGKLDTEGLKRLTEQFRVFKNEAQEMGLKTSSIFDKMGGQLKMLASRWLSIYAVVGYIRKMIDNIKELDAAMINLRRVTDETDESYSRFLKNAMSVAREMKTTASSLTEQAYQWAKLGYSMNDALELAQSSTIYMKVADVGQDQALSNLVTTLKAFNLEADDTIEVVDKLDKLNNKYAVSASGLGQGLERSASAMSMTGNTLEQTLAMLTGAGEITQSLEETGNGLKIVSLRLQNMKGKLEELGEPVDDLMTVSKVQTQILNLTHNQVDVFDQATGEFRSTYDILKDISEVWDSLSATSRASLTEILFGRQRSNVGLALIQAFQSGQVEKAYEDALNAAGTATDEYNKMMEGIQAHLDSLKGVFQELSIAVMDGSALKEIIDDGIELLTLLTNIANVLKELKGIIPQELLDAWDWIKNGIDVLFPIDALLDAADKLNGVAKELGIVDDSESSQKAKKAISDIEDVTEEYIELAIANADAKEMTTKLGGAIDDINAKYTDNKDKIDLVNNSLSENLSLLRQIKKEEIGKQLKEDAEEYKEAQDYLNKHSKYKEGYDYGDDNNAFYMNAVGIKRYTDKQYSAFESLGLNNFVSTKDTNHLYDFVLTGTPEEQLASLKKIRDVYADMDDMQQDRLDQFDEEIKRLNNEIELNKEKIAMYEKLQQTYSSITVLSAQEANMIEQATNAYQQYQEAKASGDTELADNALQSLNSIKDIVYSISDPNSGFRNEFDNFWNKFNLGSTEAKSNLEELQEEFDRLIDKDFSAEVKNLDAIDKAIESMMSNETLSHDDAWNVLKLDTDGILKDIQLVNGEYKLSTDQLTQLMQQRIEKQKESLMSIKAEAEAELELAKLRLSNLKYDPTKGAKEFAIEVSNARDEIRTAQNMVGKMGYLIDELNSRLAKTNQLTSDSTKELNNAIESLEAEVEAIEDTVDELNNRKDVLESEKKELQDQLELLKEQKKALEDQQKSLKNAVDKYMKRYEESLKNQLDAIKQQKEEIKDEYDERIKALKTENEERDLAYKKEKALLDLNNAKQQQVRTYSSARGWEYGVSKEKLAEAQKNLDDVLIDEQIQTLEKERDEKVSALEKQEKEYDKRIKAYQEYAQKYEETTEIIENADGELLAEQLLGADWREKIEKQDEGLLASYKKEYSKFADEIDRLTKNEIADIEASIKAKEAEIDEIGEEIKAYNNYKDTVKKGLDEAKKALEEYKTSAENAKTDVVNAMSGMADGFDEAENRMFDKHNRIIQWFKEIREAAEELDSTLGMGGAGAMATGLDYILHHHANGGVVDYTGLAMMHGSKSSSETVFNASQSKKLYDFVRETPNLIASVAKQAGQIAGFNPANVRNSTNNSSINVNIGQIVANNPQELTRNLDTHLDSYFRRKLTQGYTQ